MTTPVSAFSTKYKFASFAVLLLLTAALVAYRLWVLSTGRGETVCALLTAAAAAVLLLISLLSRRRYTAALPHGLPSVTFGASITGFLLLTVLVASIYFAYFAPESNRITDANPFISGLVKVFALLSAIYFLLSAASMSLPKKRALHLFLAIMPILFYAFRILNDFIDNSTMPLANSGGYHILGMIAIMLFFLCEGKMLIGNGKVPIFLAVGHIAVLLLAVYDIPFLFLCLQEGSSELEAIYSLLSIAMIIYILTRMASIRPITKDWDSSSIGE